MCIRDSNNIKYLIAGTGGVGGSIAAFLSLAGKDVTCIARGEHLAADVYKRQPLPHVKSHCILEIHLVFFQELHKEAEDEYFCQAKSEEEASVQLLAVV